MTIGTIFTLFVVPSVYVLVAKDHRKTQTAAQQAQSDERREAQLEGLGAT